MSFGELANVSPLLAPLFTAGNIARDPALGASELGAPASTRTFPPPIVYDPTAGPSLSPMQSALQAAYGRLVAHDDRRNPLGSGDWRAARGAIAAYYAARAIRPYGSARTA